MPTFAQSAEGAIVTDVDGNTFIDFAGAIGTINVGHSHPKVKEALKDQVDRYIHTGFNVMMYEPYIELTEKLAKLAPGDFEKKVMLLNSGAEAVENAVKIARKYTKRQGIVSFTRGFHGRTLLTMTMTSKVKPYKYEFGPFAPEVQGPYPYVYRRPEGMTEEAYDEFALEEFKNFLISDVAPETIAAVVMEPVQGEGGFIVPSKAFVQGVYELVKNTAFCLWQTKFRPVSPEQDGTLPLSTLGLFQDLIHRVQIIWQPGCRSAVSLAGRRSWMKRVPVNSGGHTAEVR